MTDVYTDPTKYDVVPRQWKVIDLPRLGTVVAAMLPYPGLFAEDRACLNDERFISDEAMFGSVTRNELKSICASCTVQTACREYGIAHEEYGIWGGLTPEERRKVRRERRQILVEPHSSHKYGMTDDYFAELVGERDELGRFVAKGTTD